MVTTAIATVSTIANVLGSGSLSAINPGDFNYAKQQYQNFLTLQQNAIPFSITTGKRNYQNMVITSLISTTNESTENSLILDITCQEVIIVSSQVISNPSGVSTPNNMINPQSNMTPLQQGQTQTSQVTSFNTSYLNQSGIQASMYMAPPVTN